MILPTRSAAPLALLLALAAFLVSCAPAAPNPASPSPTPPSVASGPSPTRAASATPLPPTAVPTATPSPSALPATPALPASEAAPVAGYHVIERYPHDPTAFTQGLVYTDGILYEGTGLLGRSSLRRVELETGEVLQRHDLAPELFGEGVALFDGKLYQLTWQSNVGFVYDAETFELLQTFRYPTEGWGLTDDGSRLIMSDGTATLYFLDPETLAETGRVTVQEQGQPVERLNELEWVEGEVYANVWQTERIARIDPATGEVRGWIDLTGLLDRATLQQPVDVLNGIAYDDERDRLFVTGKLWPTLFEIDLEPLPER